MVSAKRTYQDLATLHRMLAFDFWIIGTLLDGLVSNPVVIRLLRKCLLFSAIGIGVVLFLALLASQVEQRFFRSRAELLLSQVQSLELGKTPWLQAQRQLERWAGESKFNDQCNGTECSVEVTLFEPVYGFVSRSLIFVHLDDYLRWRLKLSYDEGPFVRMEQALFQGFMVMGGRPAKVTAIVGVRDGVVWSKGFSVGIETYWHNIPEFNPNRWFEYSLLADARSVPRFDSHDQARNDLQLTLHPNYLISRPDGCEVCILGYVKFTPYADPSDLHRLMQLNLSCLTRLRPCLDQSDIMPAAWKQYLAEHR
jgi:hypothetical protein